jgi:putative Mn2+ efflux pump MntP
LCLSLDNLVAGVGTDASAGWAALVALSFGVTSGCLALLGIRLGVAVASRTRLHAGWLGGAALVLAGLALLCKETLS